MDAITLPPLVMWKVYAWKRGPKVLIGTWTTDTMNFMVKGLHKSGFNLDIERVDE